ncbi:hypothetical protein [Mesorhizobium sp. ANAO-SY3R2]|uniref:hypothetical protein n=1 Tax=Mesorhizobium sp. ANAO-SY3R2 TaxID=3166644 RepID=UPI003671E3E7
MTDKSQTEPTRTLTVAAVVNDPYDGLIRTLCEAQRFGYALETLSLVPLTPQSWQMALSIRVPVESDPNFVRLRLTRHGAVVAANAEMEVA